MKREHRNTAANWLRSSSRWIVCVTLAILLHTPFFYWQKPPTASTPSLISKPARISYHTPLQPKMPLQPMAKQLVHVPKPTVAKRPKRAEFISEWDNTVSQQTRGKQTSTKSQQHKAASKRKQQQRDAQRLPQQQKGPQISSSDNSRLQQILFPSQQQLQQQMQLDFADDLSHLPTGDTTQLDTFSWRYATFFNRVKESVAQAWHPARQLRRYNPDGAGLKDSRATTQLLITINRTGELVKVVLLRSSGFDYLDQAAQMAFWRAQPFLKPPAALFGEQQQVSFRFSFVVSMRPVHTG